MGKRSQPHKRTNNSSRPTNSAVPPPHWTDQHQRDGEDHHEREDGTEGQRERQLSPPASCFGDLVGDVESLGEGACYRRDGPQRNTHPEEEQVTSCLLLGPLDHP